MHLKKWLIALLSCLIIGTSLTGCSTGQEDHGSENIRIGIIQNAEHKALNDSRAGFIDALADGGYVEGENLTIDYQNAQNDQSNLNSMAQQLSRGNDLNLAISTPAAQAMLTADQKTPSLFTAVTDPVIGKLVEDPEHPGGNMTGTTDAVDPTRGIEILQKVNPEMKTLGVIYNSSEINSQKQFEQIQEVAESKGLEVVAETVTSTNEIQAAINILVGESDGIYLPTDNTVSQTIPTIADAVRSAKVPCVGSDEAQIEACIATYGVNFYDLGRQTGNMALRIIEGEKPGDIPVEDPENLELKVNDEMSDAVGIDPQTIEE